MLAVAGYELLVETWELGMRVSFAHFEFWSFMFRISDLEFRIYFFRASCILFPESFIVSS